MPRLKVIFRRLLVVNDAEWFGSGDFKFKATVDGQTIHDESVYEAHENRWVDLDPDQWSAIVDVHKKAQIKIKFEGRDEDVFWDQSLGSITYTLRPPYHQKRYRHSTEYFTLEWAVELEVDGAFGRHPTSSIFACRSAQGAVDCTTVSGKSLRLRVEVCPIRPVPPSNELPPRPAFAPTAPAGIDNDAGTPLINPGDPINIISNPPFIPILTTTTATRDTCAIIDYTHLRPVTMNFTDDDPRLEWSVRAVAGGAVSFLGQPRGRKIYVYGTAAGEVLLELKFRRRLLAQYRALVGPIKQIACRFNICNTVTRGSSPRATPQNVRDHWSIANRFLRQMGLELIADTNTKKTDGASSTDIPGIFRIRCLPGTTRNIAVTGFAKCVRLNYRPNVMNFAYIHSDVSGNLGAAGDIPASGAGNSITESGSPSTSWKQPSGVAPDGAASPVTMAIIGPRLRGGKFPNLVGMYVTDGANGDPSDINAMQTYAGTIAHEFGHNLNLGHRIDSPTSPFNDGVNTPLNENLMHWNNPTTLAQDFDIVQTRVARQSPLVI
jgi:hypothetical protein